MYHEIFGLFFSWFEPSGPQINRLKYIWTWFQFFQDIRSQRSSFIVRNYNYCIQCGVKVNSFNQFELDFNFDKILYLSLKKLCDVLPTRESRKKFSKTPLCESCRGVWLCDVHLTEDSDSAVCITCMRSQNCTLLASGCF